MKFWDSGKNDVVVTGRSILTSELIKLDISHGIVQSVTPVAGNGDFPWISPGFFDIQVNGCRGINYSSRGFEGSELEGVINALRDSGTTRHLPTIITGPEERIVRNLEKMSAFLEERPDLAYAVPGFHVEGPFISEIDGPRGAHDAAYVREPDVNEFLRWQEAAGGRIRIVTLAPERRGALDFIHKITEAGVTAAIGHSAASPEQIREAVKAGASLSTHLGNGSHAVLPRLQNYLWEQLAEDSLSASVISDGFHLPPAVLKTFARAKGLGNLILVSDAAPVAGLVPGRYRWDKINVEVFKDGHVGLEGTPFLAGAGHLLDHDIVRFKQAVGCSLKKVVTLCTFNPARLLSLPGEETFLKQGERADLVVFRYRGGDTCLEIEAVC